MKTTQDERDRHRATIADYTASGRRKRLLFDPDVVEPLLDDADRLARLEEGLRNIPRKRVYTDWGDGGGNGGAVLWRDIESLLDD